MGNVATSEPEMLGVLSRLFAGYYGVAAAGNPSLMGTRAIVPWNVGGYWVVPDDQYVLYEMKWSTAKVRVVPFDQLTANAGEPSVYRLGNKYYPAGNAADPTGVALTFIYQPVPPVFASASSEPGDEWPDQFDEMVIVDLATYLAEKDARPEDLQSLASESAKWRGLYADWLGIADANTIRQFSVPTQVATPSVVPVGVRGT